MSGLTTGASAAGPQARARTNLCSTARSRMVPPAGSSASDGTVGCMRLLGGSWFGSRCSTLFPSRRRLSTPELPFNPGTFSSDSGTDQCDSYRPAFLNFKGESQVWALNRNELVSFHLGEDLGRITGQLRH